MDQQREAGTYRLDLEQLAAAGVAFPPILITVPRGWRSGAWFLFRERSLPTVGIQFWDVSQVYGHPCQWTGTLFTPGPTVDDLADALVEIPLRNATQPVDVSLAGYSGKYLEWSVPADIEFDWGSPTESDFPGCDPEGAHFDFKSWTGPANSWAKNRFQQAPGQVDRLWILDVGGSRLVIDAFYLDWATDQEREELSAVVDAITFEP